MVRALVVAGLVAVLASCNHRRYSGPAGVGSVDGTVDGNAVVVKDVVALAYREGGSGWVVSVVYGDVPDVCTTALLRGARSGTPTTFSLLVTDDAPVLAGTYSVVDPLEPHAPAGPVARVYTAKLSTDPTIAGRSMRNARAGSVVFTSVSPARVAGRFEATFPADARGSGGSVRGTFDAPVCPIPR